MPRLHAAARLLSDPQMFRQLDQAIKNFNTRVQTQGLWDHQNSALSAVSTFLEESIGKLAIGERVSGAIVMPTGSGKTVLAAEIARTLGLRVVILAPTVKIAFQHYEELKQRMPDTSCSLYYGEEKNLDGQIIVTTYQSAVSLFKSEKYPKDISLVFYDEAHHSISPQRLKLHDELGPISIGLTATPAFNSAKHIWSAFGSVIYELDLREAIELGILAPLRGFVVETQVDLSKVKLKVGGEFVNETEAEKHLNILARNQAARDFYLDGFSGMPAVAFCITQRHAEEFAEYLRNSNVKAAFVHGRMPLKERESVLSKFEDGLLDVVTTRDILLEGWDSKRVAMELNLRPTYSRVVKTHMLGRVLRLRPNKESGIVVEFQDIYGRGQQPLLVHHLFEEVKYRQGGLVAASPKTKKEEEEKIAKHQEVKVIGKISVSFSVKDVAKLDETEVDFTDQKLLREILLTRDDIDFNSLSVAQFFRTRFNHPKFHGTGITLLHKTLGIPRRSDSHICTAEDYKNFINYALENELLGSDSRIISTEDIVGFTFGEGEHQKSAEQRLIEMKLFSLLLDELLPQLKPIEQDILRKYFGIDGEEASLKKIGQGYDLSHSRIGQIRDDALSKLGRAIANKIFTEMEYPDKDEPAVPVDLTSGYQSSRRIRPEFSHTSERTHLSKLNEIERFVFRRRFYFGKTADQVAQMIYGESNENNRQHLIHITNTVLDKLGNPNELEIECLRRNFRAESFEAKFVVLNDTPFERLKLNPRFFISSPFSPDLRETHPFKTLDITTISYLLKFTESQLIAKLESFMARPFITVFINNIHFGLNKLGLALKK